MLQFAAETAQCYSLSLYKQGGSVLVSLLAKAVHAVPLPLPLVLQPVPAHTVTRLGAHAIVTLCWPHSYTSRHTCNCYTCLRSKPLPLPPPRTRFHTCRHPTACPPPTGPCTFRRARTAIRFKREGKGAHTEHMQHMSHTCSTCHTSAAHVTPASRPVRDARGTATAPGTRPL